jgi:acetylornithine deacetylase
MEAIQYAREFVAYDSTSNSSNIPVSDAVTARLEQLGFEIERVDYADPAGVAKTNVIARRGTGKGGLAYFCHTDVVPADSWSWEHCGAFEPDVFDDRLYGRGSCDMKGSLAAMLAAAARTSDLSLACPVYICCTGDEEVGYLGAAEVAKRSKLFAEMCEGGAFGIVGEPTELNVIHAHKGTVGFRVVSHGQAAHSSTSEGLNANLAMIPFLQVMKEIHDEVLVDPLWLDHRFDPPNVSWNIGINDHTRAINIKAAQSTCQVYFRPMPNQDYEPLLERVRAAADACGVEYILERAASPFFVEPDANHVQLALELAAKETAGSVCYGTDAVELSALERLVVLGPGSIDQAHKDDEWISLEQLELGTALYERFIQRCCGQA